MYIDLLTKIKNAEKAGKKSIKVKFTKMDKAVVDALEDAKFLKKVEVKGRSFKKVMELEFNTEKPIDNCRFLSKPSLRRYSSYKDMRKVKNGYGMLIVSTSKGIMSGAKARKEKIGGQLLFEIW